MIRQILHLALFYIRTTYQDRGVFIFNLLMPLIFTFVLGQTTQGFGGNNQEAGWPLIVVSEDTGLLAVHLQERLAADAGLAVRAAAAADVLPIDPETDSTPVLLIPADFSTKVANGEPVTLDLHLVKTVEEGQLVEAAIQAAITEVSGAATAAQFTVNVAEQLGRFETDAAAKEQYYAAAFADAQNQWQNDPPLSLHTESLTRSEATQQLVASGINQSSPGMMVMFAMFFTMGGAVALITEREQGTLRRLLVLPMSKFTLLTGKLVGIYLAGVVQIAILVLVGAFLLGANWGQEPIGLTIIILSYAFAITSLGMLLAAFARTSAQAGNLSTFIILPMSALGGAWWPLDIVPAWMQRLGHLFPTAWAMDGFTDLIVRGLGTADILREAGVLILFGLVFLTIGIWRFRYE